LIAGRPEFPGRPTAAPDNPELVDCALLMRAIHRAAAADAYAIATRDQDWFVHYLLMGTGIGCALKGFGILCGARERQDLRRWGHDFVKALAYAEQHGLEMKLSDSDRGALKLLSKLHASKAATYTCWRRVARSQDLTSCAPCSTSLSGLYS